VLLHPVGHLGHRQAGGVDEGFDHCAAVQSLGLPPHGVEVVLDFSPGCQPSSQFDPVGTEATQGERDVTKLIVIDAVLGIDDAGHDHTPGAR